uniref:Uncharacterized protein n=1 Tax=Nelumbo nucifera TaxID=4432 RepID=A0A822ZD90_NELNU|nr:TPA_asm: hypothetical protein HUJ06_000710 [Nelumbo nucifera]
MLEFSWLHTGRGCDRDGSILIPETKYRVSLPRSNKSGIIFLPQVMALQLITSHLHVLHSSSSLLHY